MILSEHLVRSDTDGKDFRTHWWKWTFGRLQQIFMQVSGARRVAVQPAAATCGGPPSVVAGGGTGRLPPSVVMTGGGTNRLYWVTCLLGVFSVLHPSPWVVEAAGSWNNVM